ncbi:MAG: hypothetical protein K5697_07740 [Lachnospiraceae bacterium]|nr:hypothetical protein [Lachnospiraceae bacterium]
MNEEALVVAGAFLALIVIITLLGLGEKRRYREYLKNRIRGSFGKFQKDEINPVRAESIPAYFTRHKTENSIDDITASDLELDRLFSAMNLTYSSAGEELLYHSLRTPLFDEKELEARRERIGYYKDHKEEREKLQLVFGEIGKNERYSLYNYLEFAETLEENRGLKLHFLAPLLVLAAVGLIFFRTGLGLTVLITVIIVNMTWYFREKGRVEPYVSTLKRVNSEINGAKKLLAQSASLPAEERDEIRKLISDMAGMRRGAGIVFSGDDRSGNPLSILWDYTNMVLHIDLICFYRMYRQLISHREEIDRLHARLGSVEALIAVASFETALSDICIPVFDGHEAAQQIYHPLITDPVKNSYDAKGCLLLTGSNASGKSTFLKTLAINQLLSQCYGFACADEFHTAFHRIYTSMSLRDDLSGGESYFMVEIRAMQRILEAGKREGAQVACYVDEVLRGTNTVERIAASSRILRSMAEMGFFTVAATHDIELTDLLEDVYENHHFEEEIKDGDVLFNYRLMNGKATSRNAIRLLSVMGYDKKIVKEAEDLAEHFMEKGSWT